MSTLCLFAAHFGKNTIPHYVKVYLLELKKHFTGVQLLGHDDIGSEDQAFLKNQGILYRKEKNEGYDFGMWYKALKDLPVENYERIALVNDSCILFKPLEKFMKAMEQSGADFYGMSFSEAVSWHLQSYFLILNKRAISTAIEYFQEQGIKSSLKEVISMYEIGLSSYLMKKGFKLSAFVDNKGYSGEFSPYYYLLNYHLQQGIPLIKKKIIFISYRKDELFTLARMNFRMQPAYYRHVILEDNEALLDREGLIKDISGSLSVFTRVRYELLRVAIQFFQTLKKLFSSSR